jgi:hypothetical protein
MKKNLFTVIVLVMVCGFSSLVYADKGREWDGYQPPARQPKGEAPNQNAVQPSSSAAIQHNQHIVKYMPGGLSESGKMIGISCTESGTMIQGQPSPLYCRDFKARDGSSWRVAFSQRHQGNAERVFKMTNNGLQPWVRFKEGGQQVVYESPGAAQYAHGGGAQTPEQGNQRPAPQVASSSSCAGLTGSMQRMCEQASKTGLFGK